MPIYMNYDGIQGSVTEAGHEKWIELMSCQLAAHRHMTSPTGRGTIREASTPNISEIVVTKNFDDASQKLFDASLRGEGKKVKIDFVRSAANKKQDNYLQIELENTLISSYTVSGHGGEGSSSPMESLSLNFTKIQYKQTLGDIKNVAGSPNISHYDLAKSE